MKVKVGGREDEKQKEEKMAQNLSNSQCAVFKIFCKSSLYIIISPSPALPSVDPHPPSILLLRFGLSDRPSPARPRQQLGPDQ